MADKDPAAASFARAICEMNGDALAPCARSRAITAIIGTIGLALAGSRHALAGQLIAAFAPGPGPSTMLGGDRNVAMMDAAFLNASTAHMPIEETAMPADVDRDAAPLVTAVLSLGEAREVDGRRLIEAVCAGLMVVEGLNAARGDPRAAAVAAAGACARMLEFNADRISSALRLAAALRPSAPPPSEPLLLSLRAAEAARDGLLAASLVACGMMSGDALPDIRPGGSAPVPAQGALPSSLFDWFEHITAQALPSGSVAILFERLETINSASNLGAISRLMRTGAGPSATASAFSRVDLAVADHLVETQWVP